MPQPAWARSSASGRTSLMKARSIWMLCWTATGWERRSFASAVRSATRLRQDGDGFDFYEDARASEGLDADEGGGRRVVGGPVLLARGDDDGAVLRFVVHDEGG